MALRNKLVYHGTHLLASLSKTNNQGRLPASGMGAQHPEPHLHVGSVTLSLSLLSLISPHTFENISTHSHTSTTPPISTTSQLSRIFQLTLILPLTPHHPLPLLPSKKFPFHTPLLFFFARFALSVFWLSKDRSFSSPGHQRLFRVFLSICCHFLRVSL